MHIRVISLNGWAASTKVTGVIKEIATQKQLEIDIENIVVQTTEEAIRYRHIGGPTIQINGLDIEPEARTIEQFGISWRRYGVSSIPPKSLIESAMDEASK